MAFEDKAIPSRPFKQGYTSLRDRLGADLSLGENTIKLNTLGDVSSILITSPITLPLPSNNFTTLGVNTNSTFTLTQQISQSQILPPTQINLTESVQVQVLSEYSSQFDTTSSLKTLPSSDIEEFTNLFDSDIVEISQVTGYEGIDFNIEISILKGRTLNGTYPATITPYNKLNSTQLQNLKYMVEAAKAYGVSDIEIKAMISVAAKESGFITKKEKDYSTTSNDRIKETFSFLKKLSDTELTVLKKDPKAFWNKVYGNKYGNGSNDAWRYIGRGFNGITFKSGYQTVQDKYNQLGKKLGPIDIVNKPESIETNYKLSAYLAVVSFLIQKQTWFPNKIFTTLDDAILFYIRGNAGFGTNVNNPIIQEGLSKALQFSKTLPTSL